MGNYIDRIIEVLGKDDQWKPIILPHNGESDSMVYRYLSDASYNVFCDRTFAGHSTLIEINKLGDETRAHVEKVNPSEIRVVSLNMMKVTLVFIRESAYSQISDAFHTGNIAEIMKAITGKDIEKVLGDNPRAEYDSVMEDLLEMNAEVAKIEALAYYLCDIDNPDRVRVIFYEN